MTSTSERQRPNTARRAAWPVALAALAGLGVLGGCGGDDKPKPLTQTQRVEQAKKFTVSITGTSPQPDEQGQLQTVQSGGSGIVVDPRQGLVLTNYHVVSGLRSIKVKVGTNTSPARIEAAAPCQDLAVIKMTTPPPGLRAAKFGGTVRAGQHVTAVGFPGSPGEGDEFEDRAYAATEGSVSVPKSEINDPTLPRLPNVIRMQTPISGGNSGGPLINDRAEVVGVVTLGSAAEGTQQQNNAIAASQARTVLNQLRTGKNEAYVGWGLTVVGRNNDLVQVDGVDPGGPADTSKFRPGDVLTQVDGQTVDNVGDVCDILESKTPGSTIKVNGLEPPYQTSNIYTGVKIRVKE